jgi:hypothetical protein
MFERQRLAALTQSKVWRAWRNVVTLGASFGNEPHVYSPASASFLVRPFFLLPVPELPRGYLFAALRPALAESAAPNLAATGSLISLGHQVCSFSLCYIFFINSSTALVIALTPVRNVGSGSGSNKLECSEGNGLPDFLLASTRAGSTAPSQNMHEGIWLSRLKRPKSSLPMMGGHFMTFSAPRAF